MRIITLIFITFLLLINSCNENLTGPEPPCFICPLNSGLTDFDPAWSPDGQTIAYIHGDTIKGNSGIYFINRDGSGNKLFFSNGKANSPCWSPDGNWLAFEMSGNIHKIKINGDSLTQLTFEGRNFFPTWSPDGEWIAYDSNNDSPNGMNFIWKMKADGTQKRRIAYEPSSGEIRMPNWSNNNKIVHHRYVGVGAPEIFSMVSNGINSNRLTFDHNFDIFPKYSPDGTMIAFSSQPSNGGFYQIWVMDSDGKNLKKLTTTQGYNCDWSPDGEYIVYTDSRAENGHLWIMNKYGSNKHQLTF